MFIQFLFNFSISMCSNCRMASFVLYDVYTTIKTYFKTWIKNKIDFLAIYFTSMIYFIDNESIEENLALNEQTRIQIKALTDDYSKFHRKKEFLLDVFAEFFPGIEEQEVFIYFRSIVSKLLLNIQDFRLFELLGEIRVRIESPDFSVFNDDNDKILFFSALIKLCHFGAYFHEEETMKYLVNIMNQTIFTAEEIEDKLFVSEFHYENSSKLAMLWLKIFTNFVDMNEKVEHLDKSIRYWESLKSHAYEENYAHESS